MREWVRPAELTSAFDEDPIESFAWGRADLDAASLEFAIGLLTTACGERAIEFRDWRAWWDEPPGADALDQAFLRLRPAFALDGDGPRFMQDLEDLGEADLPAAGLLIDSPGKNALERNTDHFVKRGRVDRLGCAAAAMALFALQCWAPSGGAGHRTGLRGGGPMTTTASVDASLWRRIWLNVAYDDAWLDEDDALERIFPWLAKTRTSETKRVTTPADVHPLACFWGTPRRIRLAFSKEGGACDLTGVEDAAVVVERYAAKPYGANYEAWGLVHPLTPHYRAKKTDAAHLPLHPKPGRLSYADWIGLVVADADDLRRPAKIAAVAEKRLGRLGVGDRARLFVAGYDTDNMKARGFLEEETPLIVAASEEARLNVELLVRRLVLGARAVTAQLERSLQMALGQGERDKGASWDARQRFYAETETEMWAFLGEADGEWRSSDVEEAFARRALAVFRAKAIEIFDDAAPLASASIKEASRYVAARRELTDALSGRGKDGGFVFKALELPKPERAGGREKRKAA